MTDLRRFLSNAIPYALWLGLLILAAWTTLLPGPTAGVTRLGVRWLVRLATVAGAYVGWQQGRPLWFYPWLGFAVYEAVALLLGGTFWLVERLANVGWFSILPALPLLVLAFGPYFIAAVWVARHDRQLAVFTVFPHAALTAPLFVMVTPSAFGGPSPDILGASVLPTLMAGAASVLVPALTRRNAWYLLYGTTVACQLAFVAGMLPVIGAGLVSVVAAILLCLLGAAILTGPPILLPIVRTGYGWLVRMGGEPVLRTVHAWELRSSEAEPDSADAFPNVPDGGARMAETVSTSPDRRPVLPEVQPGVGRTLERLYKLSVVVLAAVVVLSVVLVVARAAIYKIHEYERGLHLRGGRFIGAQNPGWHVQIPLVDTVIIVKVSERLGYVERIPAMTSDNVTMDVSLQYTYRVTDPVRYALEVDDPERIVFEFVQGKLRDVVNTKAMADVMNRRAVMNQEVMGALKEKEDQYGVQFITVQMQSASPPDEVLIAIKDRMVAIQRQEQAEAEANQKRTLADAELYAAQKQADAEAYQITTTAQAEAERIRLTSEAQRLAVRAILSELEGKGALADKYIEYLIAQELKENSKWIISGAGTPIVDLRAGGD